MVRVEFIMDIDTKKFHEVTNWVRKNVGPSWCVVWPPSGMKGCFASIMEEEQATMFMLLFNPINVRMITPVEK